MKFVWSVSVAALMLGTLLERIPIFAVFGIAFVFAIRSTAPAAETSAGNAIDTRFFPDAFCSPL